MFRAFMGLLLGCLAGGTFAQTYTGGGGHIMDDGSDNYYPLIVSGQSPAILDTNYGLETVCIDLTHTWLSYLQISVVSPSGKEFLLVSGNGGGDDNYTNTCFNTNGTAMSSGSAPFTGTWIPQGAMASVKNGQNANGSLQLHILDTYPYADEGDVISWSVTFGNQPAEPFNFVRSKLPLVLINTGGIPIPNDDKIMANFRIIDHGDGSYNYTSDSGNIYTGLAGIELRGNSSNMFPKKSYGLETRNADSTDRNVPLLGMPSESDWVLIANYTDKTLMRNFFSYRMFEKCGYYAPRMHYCEVVLDGEYQGIYLLGEKIKRDFHRVAVAAMDSSNTSYPDVTGGYIFKLDWVKPGDQLWNSNYPAVGNTNNLTYILEYPKPEDVQLAQVNYIKSYVDSFEYVMTQPLFSDPVNGYRKYIDVPSFIDLMLLFEFTKNVDGYRLSTFFYKNRFGIIKAGPPWDYDLAWGNADYMEWYDPSGWDYQVQMYTTDQCPFWWAKLMEDTSFAQQMRCRWEFLRTTVFDAAVITAEIDSIALLLQEPVALNFTKWPILGTYVWPNPSPIPEDYPGEIAKLKDWVYDRINWMDSNIPGPCPSAGVSESSIPSAETIRIIPNPSPHRFEIKGLQHTGNSQLELIAATGSIVWTGQWDGQSIVSIPNTVNAGMYLLRISGEVWSASVRVGVTD